MIISPLEGGVSSEIWRIQTHNGPICIKAALPKLKVQGDWYAPVERNTFEVAWINKANHISPGIAPQILAMDQENGLFAMIYYPPDSHPVWKTQLRDGITDTKVAGRIGQAMAQIHSQTEGERWSEDNFQTSEIFHAIRLEPYLEATASRHPEVAVFLEKLLNITAQTKNALVHGDISPKNILVGPEGPIILDAECAWYGDPAFDLAFCLNHLLLKCLWKPDFTPGYLACYDAMLKAYNQAHTGADLSIETRAAHLLPGLMLGRIDGRSPVEYLNSDDDKNRVRTFACDLLKNPLSNLADISEHWHKDLQY